MYDLKVQSVDNRIVCIHQPHLRPKVSYKTNAYVEFGSKIQVSIMKGITFLEDISWETFNEGTKLISTVENYKYDWGTTPKSVCR
jgi:transposase, IS5 family